MSPNAHLANGDLMVSGPKYPFIVWFCARTGQPLEGWENSSLIARTRGLLPLAVVIYNHFHKPDLWMHIAAVQGSMWCTPDFVSKLFYYPFVELGCGRVTGIVARRNAAVRKLMLHVGFVEEGKIREALPTGDDLIAYGMLRRECRWIEESIDVQARRTCPA